MHITFSGCYVFKENNPKTAYILSKIIKNSKYTIYHTDSTTKNIDQYFTSVLTDSDAKEFLKKACKIDTIPPSVDSLIISMDENKTINKIVTGGFNAINWSVNTLGKALLPYNVCHPASISESEFINKFREFVAKHITD